MAKRQNTLVIVLRKFRKPTTEIKDQSTTTFFIFQTQEQNFMKIHLLFQLPNCRIRFSFIFEISIASIVLKRHLSLPFKLISSSAISKR